MMVKDSAGQVSASTDDSFEETVGAPPSADPGTQHQSHEEPLIKNASARHKLKFTSSGTKLWRNLSRKRSTSHGSFKMANSGLADELIIEDSSVILQDSVQLTNCLQTQQRYLFLLSNVLVLAKQKSSANFHGKDEIRLCEIWLSDCIDQVSEVVCDRERSFVIGWPMVNMVATFASIQIRDVWLSRLQQQIAVEKAEEWPPNVVIKIINTSEAFSVVKSMLVQNGETAKDVVSRCVQEMHISSASVHNFQFWVQSDKESHPYPLIGHEFPYAIQMNYINAKQGSNESTLLTDISLCDGLKFQIVPKQTRSKLSMKLSLDETGRGRSPKKTSKIVRLFKKSSRSVEVGNIFGHHLSDLFDGEVLCAPVMDILSHLFVHGPSTVDIFRKSAIVSKCNEAKQHLDQGETIDFNGVHVGVSAALLKELLRCLPNSLLLCELYSKWIKVSTVIDNQNLANSRLKSLVQVLPTSHLIFLRYLMCILYRISLHSDYNGMTAYNLSICISPSLLWPRSSSGVALSHVHDARRLNAVVEQMIECTGEIFGRDCLHLFDHLIPEWNQSDDVGSNVAQAASLSLDIVKEESLVGGVDQDIDSTFSGLGLKSTDITPTSTCHDSGLATSNSVSLNDLVLTTGLGDCPPAAEAHSGNDFEAVSLVTSDTSVNCVSRMDTQKCKFRDVRGWFHLAFEDDPPFQSEIKDSYPAARRACESLSETCLFGVNKTSTNLSKEFCSETEKATAGILKNLNTSNTECSDIKQSLVGTEPAEEIADSSGFDMSSSLDKSLTAGLIMEQEVVKVDLSLFEVEQDLSAVGSEISKSVLSLRSVCNAGGSDDPSLDMESSICQSLPSAALPKQILSDASSSCDVSDFQHSSRCEGNAEKDGKRDEILCSPISFRGVLRRERANTCMNSTAIESKASGLNLKRGMTKCGSDIFPKCFLEGLHCTFGEVKLDNKSEEQKSTGKYRGISQTKSSSAIRGLLETPRHTMVRPSGSQATMVHHLNSFCHPMAPSTINSGHRVRPARPPSYAEAIAAKTIQSGACSSSGSGLNAAGGSTSHSLIMDNHPVPSAICTYKNQEGCIHTLPSVKSIIEYACNPAAPLPMVTVATCIMKSRALQSIPSVTSKKISTTMQSTPSFSSRPIHTVSTNSKNVVPCEQTKTTRHCGECESKPLSIQSPDMPNELLGNLNLLPSVRNKDSRLQATIVCASTNKQGLEQKVRTRKRRQRSTDPKLRSWRAFGRGIGRSKSDSSEILEKKRQEYNSDEDKENVLVLSNSFLKRKLAAMRQASKDEELRNAPHCGQCTVPYLLSMVSEENPAYANDADRECAYSPRDMKKKKSVLFECQDWQNDDTVHSSPLNGLELSDSSQHEMKVFDEDKFCEVLIKPELPLYSKSVFVSQHMSFKGNYYCPSESFTSDLHESSEQRDPSVLKPSLASTPSSDRHPYLFRAAKLPRPDAIKINWSVSKLKQAYSERSVSQSDSVACPPRMIALHDSPYFV